MREGTVPPAAIGLAAGFLTSMAAIALVVTDAGLSWATLLFIIFAGGLAAGLAAPIRPAVGAILGGVTGLFAACLLTAVTTLPAISEAPGIRPSLLDPILLMMWGMLFVPVYAVAGVVGAAVRPRLACPGGVMEGLRTRMTGRRTLAGIVVGAFCIIAGTAASAVADWVPSGIPILISAFAAGLAAGSLSRGGVRAGVDGGLLAGLLGLGVVALWGMWQLSTGPGNGVPVPLWPVTVAVKGFVVFPVVAVGGALGGAIGKPSDPSGTTGPES